MSGVHVPEALLERFVLGDLEEPVAIEVARHVDACSRCATRAAVLEPLAAAFASIDDPPVPEDLVPAVLAAVQREARPGPEPAIAAGLLALALVALVVGGAPGDLFVGTITALQALVTAGRILLGQLATISTISLAAASLALVACAWLARSLELQRRSA